MRADLTGPLDNLFRPHARQAWGLFFAFLALMMFAQSVGPKPRASHQTLPRARFTDGQEHPLTWAPLIRGLCLSATMLAPHGRYREGNIAVE